MRKGAWVLAIAALLTVVLPAASNAPAAPAGPQEEDIRAAMQAMNMQLEAMGEAVRVDVVEWIAASGVGMSGQTVYFNYRGNKQLGAHWVPADPRRGGFIDISYIVDASEGGTSSGLSDADTTAAINRAMATWNSQKCSNIPITYFGAPDFDLGYVQWLYGFGGFPGWGADFTHAGWLPGPFFDAIAPGGSSFILGATFTFIWLDAPGGNPTDINNDGKDDVAFREVYYNDNSGWAIDSDIDVVTIVLHEAGHGLSQAHFGKVFRTDKNGKLHFAPRALMNAAYSGINQVVEATDNGGHCSIWASWPNQ